MTSDGKLRVDRSRTGGGGREPLTTGLPPKNRSVNVLREAMVGAVLDGPFLVLGAMAGG